MLRNYLLLIALICCIVLLASGCGPKEEPAAGEKPKGEGETKLAQPPLVKQYTNQIDRWNAVEVFSKNKWVDEACQIVDDKDAESGKALMYPASAGIPKMAEYMNRGPYCTLEPGKYVAIFRLKVADNNFPMEKPVYLDFDATSEVTKKRLDSGGKVLVGTDFEKNVWSDQYTIEFDLKEKATLEIRVKPSNAVDTYLDYIALVKR